MPAQVGDTCSRRRSKGRPASARAPPLGIGEPQPARHRHREDTGGKSPGLADQQRLIPGKSLRRGPPDPHQHPHPRLTRFPGGEGLPGQRHRPQGPGHPEPGTADRGRVTAGGHQPSSFRTEPLHGRDARPQRLGCQFRRPGLHAGGQAPPLSQLPDHLGIDKGCSRRPPALRRRTKRGPRVGSGSHISPHQPGTTQPPRNRARSGAPRDPLEDITRVEFWLEAVPTGPAHLDRLAAPGCAWVTSPGGS